MHQFIEELRTSGGVEPICEVLEIAPFDYCDARAQAREENTWSVTSARAIPMSAMSISLNGDTRSPRRQTRGPGRVPSCSGKRRFVSTSTRRRS